MSIGGGKLSFEEQIVSKGKFLSMFSHQREAIVYIFFAMCSFEKWRKSLGYSPVSVFENIWLRGMVRITGWMDYSLDICLQRVSVPRSVFAT